MRQRLALVAAALGVAGGNTMISAGTFVTLAVLAVAGPSGIALFYGYGKLSQGGAVAAVVAFVAAAIFASAGVFYLGYVAPIVLGMAIAAGDPLPPHDPKDDRLTRPMPRRPGSER